MTYDKYSTAKVFKNEIVNILCNKIIEKVHTTFVNSEAKFVATNQLAKIIQGAPSTELQVIPFVTNDASIYGYLVKNIPEIISVNTQLSFQNRIQVVTSYAFFEFWYDETFISAVNVNGIYCRNINELN